MSVIDAVDGSSTGTEVPCMCALKAPPFGGAKHASGHDNRSRHRKVDFSNHGFDAAGKVIVHRQLKRRYVLPFFQKLLPCLVGIEACASSRGRNAHAAHLDGPARAGLGARSARVAAGAIERPSDNFFDQLAIKT